MIGNKLGPDEAYRFGRVVDSRSAPDLGYMTVSNSVTN